MLIKQKHGNGHFGMNNSQEHVQYNEQGESQG